MPASETLPTDRAAVARTPGERPVIACQSLTKVFKHPVWLRTIARAVDGLDLTINRHEIFGLLGPNGSGKSTTIKMILGLLRPTSGRVAVFGKPPSDVETKKRIGYLAEESYFYDYLNARETLDYYGRLFELDKRTRESRIDELLDMVGLSHAQHRPLHEYSKGMKRRIGIAQALINDPDLLILDEPTTGLDPLGTRQVKDLILELGRRGKTVILSSHLLADVEDVVDRMVILYGGKIRGEGTCDELLSVHSKTTIETDELDEDTITEIDRVIRERTGGEKSIRSVHAPRQKLEELFLGIVEKARADRVETAGVGATGATAAFLKADTKPEREGEALIESLVSAEPDPEPVPAAGDADANAAHAEPADAGAGVIEDLVTADDPPDSTPNTASHKPKVDHAHGAGPGSGHDAGPDDDDVDRGMIDSLLGGDGGKPS